MDKRDLVLRLKAIKNLPILPIESAQLIKVAELELKRGNLPAAFGMIVLAESYIIAPHTK